MIEPKISLSLFVPGANMISQQEAENKPNESYENHTVVIETRNKKKSIKETLNIKVRRQKLITQHINLNKEAYDYMLDCPPSYVSAKTVKMWRSLPKKERLNIHIKDIAEDLGAKKFVYEILED